MTAQTSDRGPFSGRLPLASVLRRISGLAPSFLFVLAIHFAALEAVSQASIILLVGVSLLNAVVVGFGGGRRRAVTSWLLLAALMGLVLIAVSGGPAFLTNAIVVPSLLINGMLFWVFGRTLLPGREPLIQRMSRLEVGDLSQRRKDYARALTTIWAVFFALSFFASIALSIVADLATWSWAINLGVPAAALGLFLGEHGFRALILGHEVPISPIRTIRAALRPAVWTPGG